MSEGKRSKNSRRRKKKKDKQSQTPVLEVQPTYKYRGRIDVDNQLGLLCCRIPHKFYPQVPTYYLNSSNITIIPDFIDVNIARNARTFASLIPFDLNTPKLDDIDNPPRSVVFNQLNNKDKPIMPPKYKDQIYGQYYGKDALSINMEAHSKQWAWENYNTGIWRGRPLTIKSFYHSPIYDVINFIIFTLHFSIIKYFEKNLTYGTVVLQRAPFGTCVPRHIDNCGTRRVSFIYYLTPDDWSEANGGELILEDRKILPKFNQLVLWKLGTSLTPDCEPIYHEVGEVKANNDRPRLAIVGFFDQ